MTLAQRLSMYLSALSLQKRYGTFKAATLLRRKGVSLEQALKLLAPKPAHYASLVV